VENIEQALAFGEALARDRLPPHETQKACKAFAHALDCDELGTIAFNAYGDLLRSHNP